MPHVSNQRVGLANRRKRPIDLAGKKPSAANLSQLIAAQHKRMARSLGFALTANTPCAWSYFASTAELALVLPERGALAFAALNSMPPEDAAEVVAAVFAAWERLPPPIPAFDTPLSDARTWASMAGLDELKAYALACFEAMPAKAQAAFYRHIQEIEVAA